MIVDMRFRPPYRGFLNLHVFARDPYVQRPGQQRVEPAPSLVRKSVALALEEMDQAGIDRGMVIGRRAVPPFAQVPNEDVISFVAEHPGRFYAVPGLEPSDFGAALEELEEIRVQPGVKAVHLEPGWAADPMYADDRRLYPIYRRLTDLGMPLLLSAGGTIGPDYSYVDPVHIHRVAKDFPTLNLVLGHGGWPYVVQALAVAYDCANVVLSPDMYLNVPNMPGSLEYVRAANYYLGDRLLFGTAYPARPMVESVEHFHRLPFDDDVKPKVLGLNAARVFGLD
jgi:predicted TIM-barrel fold metal-dependent hydrolase